MSLLLLHLSDIHIKSASDTILSRGQAIARATFKDLHFADSVVILITGDIAHSGKQHEYELARQLLGDIENTLRSERDIPIYIICCPGNHDCDFSAADPDVREMLIKSVKEAQPDDIKPGVIKSCAAVQSQFFSFAQALPSGDIEYSDDLWTTYRIMLNGKSIIFHAVNVSWLSQLHEQQGSLVFPTNRYQSIAAMDTDVSITLMHHPLNWFSQACYRTFRSLIRKHSHLLFFGHEHVPSASNVDDNQTGESINVEGGVLQDSSGYISSFNTLSIDIVNERFSHATYEWRGDIYRTDDSEFSWSSFRSLPEKSKSDFTLAVDFAKKLNDPRAQFIHSGKDRLSLDDLFVYPELRPLDDDETRRAVVDAGILRDPASLPAGALIKGDEKFGKSSLLRQLFVNYHERGYVPLLLEGTDLKGATEREIRKIIEHAVATQYGNNAKTIEKFWALGADRRALLIDDIHDFRIPERLFSEMISKLGRFFEIRIYTCNELFEIRGLVDGNTFNELRNLDHYTIMEFGHRKRLDLVQKWANIGDKSLAPVATLVNNIDRAENVLTSVIGRNLVPSVPFFLLTLLQSLEGSASTDLQNSAFGKYYEYLILESLVAQNVAKDELNEIFNYCAHLSWYIYQKDRRPTPEKELLQFHSAFLSRHGLDINFEKRKTLLLGASVLERKEDYFCFRYTYVYYFFLGLYFSRHIEDEEIQEIIRRSSQALYKRNNSNLILFISYHSLDKRVYEAVLSVLSGQYAQHRPMALDGDISVINELVSSAPKLIFEDRDVIENRKELRREQDRIAAARESLLKDEDQLSGYVATLISLMKTMEILGQLLKNHYGQLESAPKEVLVEAIFNGALRGLRSILEVLSENADGLVAEIESIIEKRGLESDPIERAAKAKSAMFDLLNLVTVSFIRKAALSVASPHLYNVIDKVVTRNATTAYRLIQAGVKLDAASGLDIALIADLNKDIQQNTLAQSVLRQLALIHIHLFKTTDDKKQRLCAELQIDVRRQREIDLKTKNSKRKKA